MRRRASLLVLLALALGLLANAGAAPAAQRAKWDTRVLAQVPPPGFPARAYVAPNGRIYEGTYDNPTGSPLPSRVLEYTRRGALLRSWTLRGQDLGGSHGVQVATSDSRGRLLLLDRSPARALLLDTRTGRFRRYATFADLPTCLPGITEADCSPNATDMPASANYAAWGPDGALYVTDFLQAVIWRVPPGGGKAKVWLADPRLDGVEFGTTGIILKPGTRTLLVAQQSEAGGAAGNPATGRLFSLTIRRNGKPGALKQLWESAPVDGPDGFALARSGHVYLALAGSNQIAEVDGGGTEIDRFPSDPTGANGSPIPFDTPSSAMFAGRSLIVANQSFITGTTANQAILDVYVGERGAPEVIPRHAGVRRR